MAKITFLGTGGDAYTVGRNIRGAGGIIVQLDGQQFHLDPGPGALPAAKAAGVHLRRTVGVLASHGHLNHAGDVNAVLSAMTYGGLDQHGVLLAADSVINGTEDISPSLSRFHKDCAERAISLENVPRVGINNVNIKVCAAVHDDPTAVGFMLQGEKERISYTGDTGLSEDVIDAHRGCTVLIANVPLDTDSQSQHLLCPSDALELAKAVDPELLIITHFGQQLLKEDVKAVGRDLGRELDFHVLVAEDGEEYDTVTYT